MDQGTEAYRRFLAGEENALGEIVSAYRPGLTVFVQGILRDPAAAEDVVQDTFLKLCIRRPKDQGGASFKTWLYTMARRLAIDRLRKTGRRAEAPLPDAPLPCAGDAADPVNVYLAGEEKRQLYAALSRLPEAYREALMLSYFEGCGVKELSKILKKNPHAVSALLYRAKAALKAALEKEGYTP